MCVFVNATCNLCRSPCGERGLKSRPHDALRGVGQSLPVQGAWIEIFARRSQRRRGIRRSPCGERGLKYSFFVREQSEQQSLPVRGAWIEMRFGRRCAERIFGSLPVRGAWIEMISETCKLRRGARSLPVRGAWIEIKGRSRVSVRAKVAPRAGSVD